MKMSTHSAAKDEVFIRPGLASFEPFFQLSNAMLLEVITAQSFVTAAFPTFQEAGHSHEGVSGATATTLLPETDLAAGVQRVAPIATEKTPVSLSVQRSPTPRHSGKYDRALQAWNDGHKTMRDMAEALSIPESAAYKLLVEMDKLKLIQWERKKKRAM